MLLIRCIDSMKTRPVTLHCIYPVQDDHVQVDVKVQSAAKTLDEGHHTGSAARRTSQSRALNQSGLNGPCDHSEAAAERIGPAGEEQSQGPGEAAHRRWDTH